MTAQDTTLPPQTPPPSELAGLRTRIDALDEDLVQLLNERASVSVNIGRAKQKAATAGGLPA